MFGQLLTKVLGSQNDRDLKRLRPRVAEVNEFETRIKALSDEQLKGKTAEFKTRLAGGETVNDLLPEAFAVVREAGRRVLSMRHYDVQLIGGMVLHQGTIA
jgi:preprotein translocase subunit SecA